MKVKKLGLPVGDGRVYIVQPTGKVVVTQNGDGNVVKKVTLPKDDRYLYFIDDDGDLAKEFKAPPRRSERWPKTSPTAPASQKLDARQLYSKIDALLFPPVDVMLAHIGNTFGFDEKKAVQARKVYAKELARLVKEISIALGQPTTYALPRWDGDEPGLTYYAWRFKDRAVVLSLTADESGIELSRIDDPATIDWNM